jgi:hypothetical protein
MADWLLNGYRRSSWEMADVQVIGNEGGKADGVSDDGMGRNKGGVRWLVIAGGERGTKEKKTELLLFTRPGLLLLEIGDAWWLVCGLDYEPNQAARR